ncbi:MAG TPA: glycosyltransferase family 2 protein, partial [Gemmatimonadales bacterium]|nr:glycosyltransferase family 2 protein [Gemmatimonadales bacterium]
MISIVIVSFNTARELVACLESIGRCAAALPHEIIVVDNGSADGSVEAVRTRFPAVHLVVNEENLGFSKANNQALPLVRGEYILFLNPDSELQPGTLERMLAELAGFPERAAVGPRVRKPHEFISRTCARRLPTLWTELCDLLWLDRIFPRSRILAWKYYAPWDGT